VRDWLIRRLLGFLAALPLPWVHGLGAAIAGLLVRIPNRQRRNALINIRLCFPELTASEQILLRNRTLGEFVKTILEVASLWVRPPEKTLALVQEVVGGELLARGADARGVIVLSPHLGAWELAGLYLAGRGPVTSMYRPQGEFDELVLAARQRSGARLVPANPSGIRQMLLALRGGEYVGILPDQEPKADKAAIFAPLFGVPAYTMLLVNRLASKTGARVVFMFAERLPRGGGFRVHCLAAPEEIAAEDPLVAATALNRGVEACIRIAPAQYQWTYKRFRHRPEGGEKLYTGPL
jgi:Kdo2-lipid IVA lauroyltransferase/acyltransferase